MIHRFFLYLNWFWNYRRKDDQKVASLHRWNYPRKSLKVSRSRNKIVEPQILSKNERICFSILNSRQGRKTNSFVRFSGESVAQQFCFEIYWPLRKSMCKIRPQIFEKLETPKYWRFSCFDKIGAFWKNIIINENKLYPAYLGHRVHEIADPVQENTWQHVGAKCFAGADWYACAFRSSLPILF